MSAALSATVSRPASSRLRLGTDPVRLLVSASPWRAAGFLLSYLIVSGVLFGVALTAGVAAGALAVTIVAVPLLFGAAWVIRGCAGIGRFMLRPVLAEPVRGSYPVAQGPGLWRRARSLWTNGATWRDVTYLIGLWPVLFTLDAIVMSIWAMLLAGAAFPAWYRHARDVCVGSCTARDVPGVMIGHFPHGPLGHGADGIYLNTLPSALVAALCCALLLLVFNYVLVATARLHARVAEAVLRPPADSLAPVREVLAGPGPLGPLVKPDR
jgi:hypothetical protein